MKYFWMILAFVFVALCIVTTIEEKRFDNMNALWALICFLERDVAALEEKIEK